MSETQSFDKFPRWLTRSAQFRAMKPLCFKLLAYLANIRKWETCTTRWTTTEELAGVVGASWRQTDAALKALEKIGAIQREKQRREFRLQLNYRASPSISNGRDVLLDASVEGHLPTRTSVAMTHSPSRSGRQSQQIEQAEPDAQWVTERDVYGPPFYTPGSDQELAEPNA